MHKSNIVVIGMPGSGKSTLGKVIAKKRGLAFVDTDSLIEARENMPLQDVVNRRGVKYLREAEAELLKTLDVDKHMISTGGSAVYNRDAMHNLGSAGVIIYLRISLATLLRRVTNESSRGLAKMKSHSLPRLYAEREPLYASFADLSFDNDWPITALNKGRLYRLLDDYYDGLALASHRLDP